MSYYKIHKFKDGGTLLYREDKSVDAVDVSINISTGAVADGDKPGLTHFLEHMLFCETTKRKEKEIDKKSAELHNIQNAYTSRYSVGLEFCTPTRNLEESMKHNGEILLCSTFPEDKIKREKEVVISEMLMSDGHDIFEANLLSMCYGVDNELFNNIVGTEESIRSITRQDLLDYRIKHFNRNNLVISMVGNVSYQDAKDLCNKYIVSKIAPNGPMFIPDVQNVYLHRDFNFIYFHSEGQSSYIQIAFPFVGKQNYKNVLLSYFLNKILNKRIHDQLRLDQGLMYGSYVYDMQFANDGLKIIELETANHKTNSVIRAIANLTGDCVKNGISEEEFLLIKQDMIDAKSFGTSNVVIGKSKDIYHSYINNDRIYTDKEKQDIFNTVTVQDLNEYMLKILDTNEIIVNYMGDRQPNQMYNSEQIEALFLLNRFTPEQLLEHFEYQVPDMGCPGEYVEYKQLENGAKQAKSSQLLIQHFENKKRTRKKKEKNKVKKIIFEDLPKEKRDMIKEYFKSEGFDLDEVAKTLIEQDLEM